VPGDIAQARSPYISPGETYETVGGKVAAIAFTHPGWRRWWLAFLGSLGLVALMAVCVGWLLYWGVDVWGNNIPVTWAQDIISYDWWMGIGTGALFVSAALLLANREWRSALNRAAETIALVAAGAAALYPIIHLGRPWFFYWNIPHPNTYALWPQFRSPLFWDAMAIISYLVISVSIWYVGMLPDLASLRDRPGPLLRRQLYGILALGWRGSAIHWVRWVIAYRTLAALGITVVVALQSGAAVMFAGILEPGWHDTLLPAFFIIGAVFSGLAMMAVVSVVLRFAFPLTQIITETHLDILGRLLLGLGLANTYCYAVEFFTTALGGDSYDVAMILRRLEGPDAWCFWMIVGFALVPVQLFWFRTLRRAAVHGRAPGPGRHVGGPLHDHRSYA
jgi:Ni/Fe-hydrogenase subunit HybB-like protein